MGCEGKDENEMREEGMQRRKGRKKKERKRKGGGCRKQDVERRVVARGN